jgi:hypothetical protein
MQPIWRDRVWLSLLIGPFVWAGVVMLLTGWPQEGVQFIALYAQGMCGSVAAVSVFLPLIGHPSAAKSSG